MKKNKNLITAALPYANGPLHIGHIAGAYLPADIYARFLRLKGEDVAFICGSDEHGAAITLRAKKENISPQEIVDKYHAQNKKAFAEFGISFDEYFRTSDKLHHEVATDFFIQLYEKNVFEKKEKKQFYDEEYNQFLADRYIIGTCPKCNFENAYGDQCEKCGSSLTPTDLINPLSFLSGKKPSLKKTKHWYLPMNKHQKWIKEWISNGILDGKKHHDPKLWRKQVIGQCLSWINAGLEPRAMTRDLNWGVKVPLKEAKHKVLYVWLDAPVGYISATKNWAIKNNKNWEDYWCGENAKITHFIAKDNIVFHCIIFPILLKANGNYNLPVNVPSNEFLNLEGNKISTSREWAVWLYKYLQDLPNKKDELRYVLTSISPENKDSEFTWKIYQEKINNELVAVLGNFVNRTLVLTQKYYSGKIPKNKLSCKGYKEIENSIIEIPKKVEKFILLHRYKDALNEAMKLARIGNKYLADQEPWKIVKTSPEKVQSVIYNSIQIVACLSVTISVFLPNTAQKIKSFLNIDDISWDDLNNFPIISTGHEIKKPSLLFQKIEDDIIETQLEKLKMSTR